MVNLTVRDPLGFRGTGHRQGNRHIVELGPAHATPGYLAGPLQAGRWEVILHTHLLLSDVRGELRVDIDDHERPPFESGAPNLPAVRPPEPGSWMMGDLHCHTNHSDARWTPAELALAATERGLQFLAVTDHNTTSAREPLRALAPGLLQLPGIELTTYYGHAVILGLPDLHDWTRLTIHRGMRELASHVAHERGIAVIAHPLRAGDPICTGCTWTYFDWRPADTTHLEVWNGPWDGAHNTSALELWYSLLASGHRVIATAGTDAHGPAYHPQHGFTCTPATNDAATLLEQLRRGETYLSRQSNLTFAVHTPAGPAGLGSCAPAGRWTATVSWRDLLPGSTLHAVSDGRREVIPVEHTGSHTLHPTVHRWLNFEVRLSDGSLHALSNPVFAQQAPLA
ncbi:phosphoesterase [Deinococcus metallilatus]|nr:phosphoesterase [Deinococcus metallilatus]